MKNVFPDISLFAKRMLAISAALFVLSAGAYGALAFSVSAEIDEARAISAEVEKGQEEESAALAVKKLLRDIEPDIRRMERYFFTEEEAVDFLETIERAAASAGVSLQLLAVGKTEEGGLSVRFDMFGDWKNQYRFLLLLEALPARVVIRDISLTYTPESERGSWRGNAAIILKSFTENGI